MYPLLLCPLLIGLAFPSSAAPQDRPSTRPAPGSSHGGRPSPGGGNRPSPGGGNRPSPGGGNRPSPGGGNRPSPGGGSPSRPQPQPPRPGGSGGDRPNPGGGRPPSRPGGRPPSWGRPPQSRPSYHFRPSDRDLLRRHYLRHFAYINRARRPVFLAGGFFPYADIGYLTPVPFGLYGAMPPIPPGYQAGYFDGYVVVYDPFTYFIADVLDLLQ